MTKTQDLQLLLKKHLEETGVSAAVAAKAIGVTAGTLSQWINNKYNANTAVIDEKVSGYLDREAEKSKTIKSAISFVNVANAKAIFKTARTCHLNAVMGMVYGASGLGKTTASEEYASRYKDTIYLLANRSYSPKVLFKKLHMLLGFDGKGYVNEMLDDVIEKLKDSGRLIIIDQAEYLNNHALHLLRTVYDEAKVGILLIGLDELFFNIRGQRGEFAQLYTRITIPVHLREWKSEDVQQVVTSVFRNASDDIWKEFEQHAKGNGMMLKNLIFNAQQFAELNGGKLTSGLIKEAAKLLIN